MIISGIEVINNEQINKGLLADLLPPLGRALPGFQRPDREGQWVSSTDKRTHPLKPSPASRETEVVSPRLQP